MPELPEVEAARRLLEEAFVGKRISGLSVLDKRVFGGASIGEFHHALRGAEVMAAGRRGKYLFFPILSADGQRWLIVHFGMTGWFYDCEPPHPVMKLELDGGGALWLEDGRKFSHVWLHGGRISDFERIAALGPEADRITVEGLRAVLDSKRDVKTLLLDQGRIAGVGNIYANEALWMARVHPLTEGIRVKGTALTRLHRSLRRVIANSVEFAARTLSLAERPVESDAEFRELLRAYGREKEPCVRHKGQSIRRIVHAGRSSFICPVCQRSHRGRGA